MNNQDLWWHRKASITTTPIITPTLYNTNVIRPTQFYSIAPAYHSYHQPTEMKTITRSYLDQQIQQQRMLLANNIQSGGCGCGNVK